MGQPTLDIDKFVNLVFHEGTLSTLFGTPGAGKTNLAVLFMEFLVERGYNVYTIINFFDYKQIGLAIKLGKLAKIKKHTYVKKPDEIHIVWSLSGLLIGLLTTENNVVVIDEGGFFGSSVLGTSTKVRQLKELAFIIRHLSSSFLLIAQSKGSIVPDLRSTLVEFEMRVRKYSKYGRMFTIATAIPVIDDFTGEELVKFEIAEGDEYYNVLPTKYPFDSKYTPVFDMDIDLSEALKRLSVKDGRRINSIEIRQIGAEIIEKMMDEKLGKKGGISGYRKVGTFAKKYGITPATVRRMCDDGRVEFYVTDSGHRMIIDRPPKKGGMYTKKF